MSRGETFQVMTLSILSLLTGMIMISKAELIEITSFSGLSGSGLDLLEGAGRGRGGAGGGLSCFFIDFFVCFCFCFSFCIIFRWSWRRSELFFP